MRPDVPAGMTLDPLPFFDPEAAWPLRRRCPRHACVFP